MLSKSTIEDWNDEVVSGLAKLKPGAGIGLKVDVAGRQRIEVLLDHLEIAERRAQHARRVGRKALDPEAALVDERPLIVKAERAGPRIIVLRDAALSALHDEEPIAAYGHVRGDTRVVDGALREQRLDPRERHALTCLVRPCRADDELADQILKVSPRRFEPGCVHVCEVVADDTDCGACGSESRVGRVQRGQKIAHVDPPGRHRVRAVLNVEQQSAVDARKDMIFHFIGADDRDDLALRDVRDKRRLTAHEQTLSTPTSRGLLQAPSE